MIYLGLPLSPFEAGRLFGMDKTTYDDYRQHYYDTIDFVECAIKENELKFGFHCTKKMGRYIIGHEIGMNVDVESFAAILDEMKADFKREIAPFYENHPNVELYLMDETNVVVHHPEPYIIDILV
jgi:hypothetical protein